MRVSVRVCRSYQILAMIAAEVSVAEMWKRVSKINYRKDPAMLILLFSQKVPI